jgi:hypothetical protein
VSTLRRLVVDFRPEGVQLRTLYRCEDGPGPRPGPGTKARVREASALARGGLERALEALAAGDAADLGTAGFETREDVLFLQNPRPAEHEKGAA